MSLKKKKSHIYKPTNDKRKTQIHTHFEKKKNLYSLLICAIGQTEEKKIKFTIFCSKPIHI